MSTFSSLWLEVSFPLLLVTSRIFLDICKTQWLKPTLACNQPGFWSCTWKVILIRCIFIPHLPLVAAPYTEDLGGGGVSGVTKPDGGLLGGFHGTKNPPQILGKDAWGIWIKTPWKNLPSQAHKSGGWRHTDKLRCQKEDLIIRE